MATLVTGAAGHLGANLVRRLLDRGEDVRVLLRQGSNNAAVEGLDVEKVYGDLRDWQRVLAAVKGCDRIYHCAAEISTVYGNARFQQELYESNVSGTRNLLRSALQGGVTRVIVTGSSAALGYVPGEPSNENMPFYPFTKNLPYETVKVLAEQECLKAFADGLDVVIVQSWAIVGPNDFKPSRLGRALIDFARDRLPAYTTGGRDWVAARDIVNAHLLAMEKGRSGQAYTISSEFLTVPQIMELFEKVTGKSCPTLCLPASMMAGIARVADVILPQFIPPKQRYLTSGAIKLVQMNQRADWSKAKQELGYQPTISIEQAIVEAYTDFIERGIACEI